MSTTMASYMLSTKGVVADTRCDKMEVFVSEAKEILSTLTSDNAGDWQFVGELMKRLNQVSMVSQQGRPWHDVVLEALAQHGNEISSGHLHRIRRAFTFLEAGMWRRNIPKDRIHLAKISSIDLAERLYQLDEDAGFDALELCLDIKNPATKVDVQKIYEDYLKKHPEKKSPMQAAWDRRRSGAESTVAAEKFQTNTVRPTNLAETLHGLADYVGMLEISALAQAERIKELEQELIDVNAELVEIQQSHQIISEELREARFRNH